MENKGNDMTDSNYKKLLSNIELEFKVYNALVADWMKECITLNKHDKNWAEGLRDKILVSKTKLETMIDVLGDVLNENT